MANPQFRVAMDEHFPGAMLEMEYVAATAAQLRRHGFTRKNTLPCVAVCRDEIATSLVFDVETAWGPAFSFASLGGMLTAGRTGFSAATAHAPIDGDKQHFVFYAMPHIAISAEGQIGSVLREGVPGMSHACGALVGFREELESGTLDISLDHLDVEQSLLKQRLIPMIEYGSVPDLDEMTRLAAEAIEGDLWELFQAMTDQSDRSMPVDGAMFTGVQIHGPDGVNYVWPRSGHIEVDGQLTELEVEGLLSLIGV